MLEPFETRALQKLTPLTFHLRIKLYSTGLSSSCLTNRRPPAATTNMTARQTTAISVQIERVNLLGSCRRNGSAVVFSDFLGWLGERCDMAKLH